MSHQLTAKSTFASKYDEAVRVAIRRNKRTKKQVYLLRVFHIESLPGGFNGFSGHRRAPHQKLQANNLHEIVAELPLKSLPSMVATWNRFHRGIWGSLSLPSRFKPDLGLFRTFEVDLSTSPGCGCRLPSPCVGPVGIEPTLTRCKSSG